MVMEVTTMETKNIILKLRTERGIMLGCFFTGKITG